MDDVTCGCGGEIELDNYMPGYFEPRCVKCGLEFADGFQSEADAIAAVRLATRATADDLLREALEMLRGELTSADIIDKITAYLEGSNGTGE